MEHQAEAEVAIRDAGVVAVAARHTAIPRVTAPAAVTGHAPRA